MQTEYHLYCPFKTNISNADRVPSTLPFFKPISYADRVPEGRSGPAYNLVLENKPIPAQKLNAVRITYQEEAFDYELDYS